MQSRVLGVSTNIFNGTIRNSMCSSPGPPKLPVIIVHGGAWAIPTALWERSQQGVSRAASEGYSVLERGGSALDAVESAVRVLEDDPVFDAGTGSVLNEEGNVEMDSVVMDGSNLGVGAVAAVQNIANPVSLARLVMEQTQHCLLVGSGANKFAAAQGVALVSTEDLVTPEAREDFEDMQKYKQSVEVHFRHAKKKKTETETETTRTSTTATAAAAAAAGKSSRAASDAPAATLDGDQSWHDTVGAVAMDEWGNVAAATSTGGITMKMAGRVGDSPLVGAGAYADNKLGGASTTGHGESITKVLLAHAVLRAMQSPALTSDGPLSNPEAATTTTTTTSPAEACRRELANMHERVGGSGGVVCLSADGMPGLGHTTEKMPWAVCQPSAVVDTAQEEKEEGGPRRQQDTRLLRCGMDSSEAPPDLCVVF